MADTRRTPLVSEYGIKTWDDLRLFLAVVRGGHFQGAARIMRSNQTTVARRFRRMEEVLGTKLFERFGQELKLTRAGEAILDRAVAIEQLTQEVSDHVRALDVLPTGTVTLSVTEGLGHLWLASRLTEFCKAHPEINLEVIPSHGEYDLLTKGVDVAIGWGRPTEPRLVGSKVGSISFMLFVSPAYIEEFGTLDNISQLDGHRFLQYDTHEYQRFGSLLMERAREENRIKLRTSSVSVYLAAVRAGIGIGFLPTFYRYLCPDLAVMPVSLPDRGELWIASHEETNKFNRTRMLLNFLRADFRKHGRQLFE